MGNILPTLANSTEESSSTTGPPSIENDASNLNAADNNSIPDTWSTLETPSNIIGTPSTTIVPSTSITSITPSTSFTSITPSTTITPISTTTIPSTSIIPSPQSSSVLPKPAAKKKTSVTKRPKRLRRSFRSAPDFKKHIRAVQKIKHPSLSIGCQTVSIVNNYMGDMLSKLATDAKKQAQNRGRRTITECDMQTATRLLLPVRMAQDAQSFAAQRVAEYRRSVETQAKAAKLNREEDKREPSS